MDAVTEYLTIKQAAIAAGVPVAKINRMIDKRILPKVLYRASQNRTVRKDACLWIAFYFETEDVLTAGARVKTMRKALAHEHTWPELRQCKFEESRTVQVLLSSIWDDVDRRLSQLRQAQELVIEAPEILSGTPVIRGTRIPVYDVASLVDAGTPVEELREIYPKLTPSEIDLASKVRESEPPNGGAHGVGTFPKACRFRLPKSEFTTPRTSATAVIQPIEPETVLKRERFVEEIDFDGKYRANLVKLA